MRLLKFSTVALFLVCLVLFIMPGSIGQGMIAFIFLLLALLSGAVLAICYLFNTTFHVSQMQQSSRVGATRYIAFLYVLMLFSAVAIFGVYPSALHFAIVLPYLAISLTSIRVSDALGKSHDYLHVVFCYVAVTIIISLVFGCAFGDICWFDISRASNIATLQLYLVFAQAFASIVTIYFSKGIGLD